ncbi:phage holin family protein [Aeromicrobium wangtongii]|uniref:Phage holin family protein n=1 Tax=Aeromicrobium wangtongii TaxID=2969247 RepID=A0ABY5M8M8_9ACTN|nr:phage holin family protein [Aeromicrobium wangtongii]MCD9198960.1 phage holin family protein [Aeromicrobium wangtongii]UUP13003.1 phage holin family protein [Aeromicrobium wangtongii]
MPAVLKSILISAAANTVSLALAAWIFEGFTIELGWFVLAVVIFTVLTVALRGVVISSVNRFMRGYTIVGGLVLTLLGLEVTDLLVPTAGFSIDGWGTWLGVTLIVWAAGVAYGEVDNAAPQQRTR